MVSARWQFVIRINERRFSCVDTGLFDMFEWLSRFFRAQTLTPLPSLLPLPLEQIVMDVNRAIGSKLYYPALVVALTLPEVCVALKMDKDVYVKGTHYEEFVDKYTREMNLGIDGKTCYQLRGGVVHRGNLVGHNKISFRNVIFYNTRG